MPKYCSLKTLKTSKAKTQSVFDLNWRNVTTPCKNWSLARQLTSDPSSVNEVQTEESTGGVQQERLDKLFELSRSRDALTEQTRSETLCHSLAGMIKRFGSRSGHLSSSVSPAGNAGITPLRYTVLGSDQLVLALTEPTCDWSGESARGRLRRPIRPVFKFNYGLSLVDSYLFL